MIKQTEILVIGGGPAGLSAACAAAELGASVLLCERDYLPGGQLVKQTHKFFGSEKQYAGERGIHIGNLLIEKAKHHPNIEILTEATVLGIYEDGIVTVFYHGKHLKIRPSKIILATGASEKFLEFPGNDLPGIYGAGAAQQIVYRNREITCDSLERSKVGLIFTGFISGKRSLTDGNGACKFCLLDIALLAQFAYPIHNINSIYERIH